MIIITSGPDKTGKTTLSEALTEHYDAVYIKCSKQPRDKTEFLVESYVDMFQRNPNKIFVCDRFNLVDDRVYEPVIADLPTVFDKDAIDYYENTLIRLDTILLITDANASEIKRRYRDAGGDWYTTEDHIEYLRAGYRQLKFETRLPAYVIDSSLLTIGEMLCAALELIEDQQQKWREEEQDRDGPYVNI